MPREHETENVICVFLIICGAFGCVIGFIGLGIGLLFLDVTKSFGLAFLSGGLGAIFGGGIGGKRILRAIVDTMEEKHRQSLAAKAGGAPVTKAPSAVDMRGVSV